MNSYTLAELYWQIYYTKRHMRQSVSSQEVQEATTKGTAADHPGRASVQDDLPPCQWKINVWNVVVFGVFVCA